MKHILITLIGLSIGATAGVFAADGAAPAVTPQADEAFAQLSPEDQEVVKIIVRGVDALKNLADAAEKVVDGKDTAAIDDFRKKTEELQNIRKEAVESGHDAPPSEAAAQYLETYFTNRGDNPQEIALRFIREFTRIVQANFYDSEVLRSVFQKMNSSPDEPGNGDAVQAPESSNGKD